VGKLHFDISHGASMCCESRLLVESSRREVVFESRIFAFLFATSLAQSERNYICEISASVMCYHPWRRS